MIRESSSKELLEKERVDGLKAIKDNEMRKYMKRE